MRLLPPVLKVFGSWGSGLHHEGSPWKDLQKPLRVMIVGTQADSRRVLLAHHAKRRSNLCQNLRQMPKIQQHHPTAVWRVDPYDSPMAIRLIGVRHHGVIPNSDVTTEVLNCGHRLFHKMGRSWNLSHHYREERKKLHLEVHHMQV